MTRTVLAAFFCATANANDTALNVGRYGPEPVGGGFKEESIIEMVKEELLFEVGADESHVEATFTFLSHKKGTNANQLVGFPDEGVAQEEGLKRAEKSGKEYQGPEVPVGGPLKNLVTRVNGEVVPAKIEYGYVNYQFEEEGEKGSYVWKPGTPKEGTLMAWHAVPVVFPPGKEVTVQRSYDVENGGNSLGVRFFEYSTHTGAAWRGPIGSMNLVVKLRDGLTIKDLVWKGEKLPNETQQEFGPWTSPDKAEWEIVSPSEMRLVWKNFEPRTEPNRRQISLVFPAPKQLPTE